MEPTRDAVRDLPILTRQLATLLEMAKGCTANVVVLESDDFGFMVVNFLNKQITHSESLLLLVPRIDTSLIARTMFDGLVQLYWASQNPSSRGRQWRAFALVQDWRRLQLELGG